MFAKEHEWVIKKRNSFVIKRFKDLMSKGQYGEKESVVIIEEEIEFLIKEYPKFWIGIRQIRNVIAKHRRTSAYRS